MEQHPALEVGVLALPQVTKTISDLPVQHKQVLVAALPESMLPVGKVFTAWNHDYHHQKIKGCESKMSENNSSWLS